MADKEFYLVSGYWRDDNEKFEDRLCQVGGIEDEDDPNDINIFMFFDTEGDILGADSEMVRTSYRRVT